MKNEVLWSDQDYAKLADWIGTEGKTSVEISQHFNGCNILSKIRYMFDKGIIKSIPIEGAARRVKKGGSFVRYVQVSRVIPHVEKGRPVKHGRGPTKLRVVPLSVPQVAMPEKLVAKPDPVDLGEAPNGVNPGTAYVVYNAATKKLYIDGANIHLHLENVNLKLELK